MDLGALQQQQQQQQQQQPVVPDTASLPSPSPASDAPSSSSSLMMKKVPVHIEARMIPGSAAAHEHVKQAVLSFLQTHVKVFRLGVLSDHAAQDPFLRQHIECLTVTELGTCGQETAVSSWRAVPLIHVYALYQEEHVGGTDFAFTEEGGGGEGGGGGGGGGGPTAFTAYLCPCRELLGCWDSIHVATSTKQQLLSLAEAAMVFSQAGVDSTLVSGNRLIMLYGPAGTGKTSLSCGLAQKLAIRHGETFSAVELLSVNAHALLSKFWGESSRLVVRVFSSIREKVAEETTTLFVLAIDEIETICGSRAQALAKGSNEPSDAVRVVNAVLTQVDRLRAFPNVLCVTTSNVTQALDEAFLDRCDLKLYVGLPAAEGRYVILRSTLMELMRVEVITPRVSLPERLELLPSAAGGAAAAAAGTGSAAAASNGNGVGGGSSFYGVGGAGIATLPPVGQQLLRVIERTDGASGRALRKLPLLAHSLLSAPRHVSLGEFLCAMEEAVKQGKIVESE